MARPSTAGDSLLQEDRIKSQGGYSPETGRTTCSSRSRCDGGGWCSVVSNPVSDSESIRQWPQILRANGGRGGLSIDGEVENGSAKPEPSTETGRLQTAGAEPY
jgi:hypothetical protein